MGRNVLTDKEKRELTELLEITNSIQKIYSKLYNLEVNGQIQSPAYKKLLKNLKLVIEQEEKTYQKMNLTYHKCIRIIQVLRLKNEIDETIFYSKNALFDKGYVMTDDRILSRIKYHLVSDRYLFNRDFFHKHELQIDTGIQGDDETESYIEQMILSDDEMREYVALTESLSYNITCKFLVLLQDYIIKLEENNLTNHLIQIKYNLISSDNKIGQVKLIQQLLQIKYNLIATDKKLEHTLINNQFQIKEFKLMENSILPDKMPIDFDILQCIYACNLLDEQVQELLEISNYQYYKESKHCEDTKLKVLLNELYLRSILFFNNHEEIEQLKQKYYKEVFWNREYEKSKSAKILMKIFENTETLDAPYKNK